MATLNRRPLVNRPLHRPGVFSPLKTTKSVPSSKRARSPDLPPETINIRPTFKRAKPAASPSTVLSTRELGKEHRHTEREQQKAEFKEKYTRAFPSWTFYFDLDNLEPDRSAVQGYESKIHQLGGAIEDFFSKEITHVITNRPLPDIDISADKENNPKGRSENTLRSPIKLKSRTGEDTDCGNGFDLINKALSFNLKIWNTTKLESVLIRLVDTPFASTSAGLKTNPLSRPLAAVNSQRSLSRLLQSERIHGTTERDPTQKRHDFRYFSRGSRFVLVEDMRQELATITAYEYHIPKGREATNKAPWPVLHCHPHARGPFLAYDEREKKRWEKLRQTEVDEEDRRKERRNKIRQVEAMKRRAEAHIHAQRTGDLRRSVSMNNLHHRAMFSVTGSQGEHMLDLAGDGDNQDSANASGFLASGAGIEYMAASGNSVWITSTTGTTSNAGYTSRNMQLPLALSGRMKQQVVTSRKFPSAAAEKHQDESKVSAMGPPACIPAKQPVLRKSRSTNTLKLPKREEGSKPGYCESCRVKFEDFKSHIAGRKHRKFATDDANFLQLDCVLARVQRRTIQEVEDEQKKRQERRKYYCGKMVAKAEGYHMFNHQPPGNIRG